MILTLSTALLAVPAQGEDARAWFERMERALTEAETLRVRSSMDIPGDEETSLDLAYRAPDKLAVTLNNGDKTEFRCDGETMATATMGDAARRPAQEGMGAQLLTALARFGAVGAAWSLPDFDRGRQLLDAPALEGFEWLGREEVEAAGGERRAAVGVGYSIRYEAFGPGTVIEMRVWLDPETALPIRRELTAEGQTVVELYETVELNAAIEDIAFHISEDWGLPPRVESHAWVPEARRVRLEMAARPASEAFAEIARQTGWRLGGRPRGDRAPVTVSLADAPALAALDEVCRQAGLTWETVGGGFRNEDQPTEDMWNFPNEDQPTQDMWDFPNEEQPDEDIRFAGGTVPAGPVAYVGPFSVRLLRVDHVAEIDYAREEPRRTLDIVFQVGRQPGTMLTGLDVAVRSAADDAGNPLREAMPTEDDSEMDRMMRFGENDVKTTWELKMSLGMPPREARRIARLEAEIEVSLPRWHGEVEFAPSAEAQERDLEEVTLRLEPFQAAADADEVTLRVVLTYDELNAMDYPTMDVEGFDADGRPWTSGRSNSSSSGGQASATHTLRRDEAGPLAKAVVRYHGGRSRMVFPFVLEDIPLGEERR